LFGLQARVAKTRSGSCPPSDRGIRGVDCVARQQQTTAMDNGRL